jgi:hypothetical protein
MNIVEEILRKIFDYKELLIASFGWLLVFVEFIINRNITRQDKRRERKYQAYSGYMRKADEVMNNARNDPAKLLDINSDFFKQLLNNMGNEKVITEHLIEYNEHIKEFAMNATQPSLILRQELNEMKLICSDELLEKIGELDKLAVDYNNAVQKNLAETIPGDIDSTVAALQTLTQDKRWYNFEALNNEILNIMRKEIGS